MNQFALSNPPKVQKVKVLSWTSLEMLTNKPIKAPAKALTAIPDNNIAKILVLLKILDILYTMIVVKKEPNIAKIGKINGYKKEGIKKAKKPENIIAIIAPTAAPLDTPINPGSIRGFLNKPWRIAPDVANPTPTKIAKNILGKRILINTVSCIWLNEYSSIKPNLWNKISKICFIDIDTGPYEIDKIVTTNRMQTSNIKKYFLFLLFWIIKTYPIN